MKRAIAVACFAVGLLSLASAQAGSFHNSPAKLNDKYLAGKSGGWYGIGGPESKIFKKKTKIVPCCNNSKR